MEDKQVNQPLGSSLNESLVVPGQAKELAYH
jgi:hypothetical protein